MSFWDIFDLASPAAFAAAAVAVVFAGFLRGFVGFGAALVTAPVLSLAFSPTIAVAIAFLSGLPAVVQLLPTAIRYADRPFILPVAIGCFLFAPVGAFVLVAGDPRLLKIGIAAAVVLMTMLMWRGWRFAGAPGRPVLFVAGAIAGVLQGLAGIGGPPVVTVALARPGAPETQRGNVLAAVTALTLAAAIPFWGLGLFTAEALWLSLLFVPLHTAAAWGGTICFEKIGRRHYRRAALTALTVVGVASLVAALQDYLSG